MLMTPMHAQGAWDTCGFLGFFTFATRSPLASDRCPEMIDRSSFFEVVIASVAGDLRDPDEIINTETRFYSCQ